MALHAACGVRGHVKTIGILAPCLRRSDCPRAVFLLFRSMQATVTVWARAQLCTRALHAWKWLPYSMSHCREGDMKQVTASVLLALCYAM